MTTLEQDPPMGERESDVDPVPLHEPIWREMTEPRDGYEPTPMWLVFACMLLLGWGGYYLGTLSFDFRADVLDMGGLPAAAPAATTPAALDPVALGKRVYNHCAPCHQRDGAGVAGVYPPLAGSAVLLGPPQVPAAIVLHGLEGPWQAGGRSYNNAMPGWEAKLSDEQVAAVLTFARAAWGNVAPPVDAALVAQVRQRSAGQRQPWRAASLATFAAAWAASAPTEAATAR
jgi:mono/diheme cytochrome c family protein